MHGYLRGCIHTVIPAHRVKLEANATLYGQGTTCKYIVIFTGLVSNSDLYHYYLFFMFIFMYVIHALWRMLSYPYICHHGWSRWESNPQPLAGFRPLALWKPGLVGLWQEGEGLSGTNRKRSSTYQNGSQERDEEVSDRSKGKTFPTLGVRVLFWYVFLRQNQMCSPHYLTLCPVNIFTTGKNWINLYQESQARAGVLDVGRTNI